MKYNAIILAAINANAFENELKLAKSMKIPVIDLINGIRSW
jgi:ABC-type sugar transport system substrate-binding protein